MGAVWAIWHLPLFFITGTVQSGFGLISWSGLLFTLSVFPMALLTACSQATLTVVLAVLLLVALVPLAVRRRSSTAVTGW